MSANALKGQGVTIGIGNGAAPEVFTAIGEITSIKPPDMSGSTEDASDLDSTNVTSVGTGIIDYGTVEIGCFYLPADTQHALLKTTMESGAETNFQLTYTDTPATTEIYACIVTGLSVEIPKGGLITASFTLKVNSVT